MMRTTLYEEHVSAGAKMVDFHGWEMPIEYSSIMKEHMNVRTKAGIFDVSHMGDILVEGPDAVAFLEHMLPTSISTMNMGEAAYSAFLDDNGCMIDDVIVYIIEGQKLLVVPNAATKDTVMNWMVKHRENFRCTLKDLSDQISCIALQGPETPEVLRKMNIGLPDSFKFSFFRINSTNNITGDSRGIISATGYTGERGVEFIIPNTEAVGIWRQLIKELAVIGSGPCGLGARDTLRMEKGFLLSGQDFNRDRDPVETSISFIMTNQGDFIGKGAMERRKSDNIFRGFILEERGIPRTGSRIFSDGSQVGEVTSGTFSPVLGKGIALGYISRNHSSKGKKVDIEIRGKMMKAVVSRPKMVP